MLQVAKTRLKKVFLMKNKQAMKACFLRIYVEIFVQISMLVLVVPECRKSAFIGQLFGWVKLLNLQ